MSTAPAPWWLPAVAWFQSDSSADDSPGAPPFDPIEVDESESQKLRTQGRRSPPAATRGLRLSRPNSPLHLERWSGFVRRLSMVVRFPWRARKSSVPVGTAAWTSAPPSATAAAVLAGQPQGKSLSLGARPLRSPRLRICAEGAPAPRLPPPARWRAPARHARDTSLPSRSVRGHHACRGHDQCTAPRPRPPIRSVAHVARELRGHRCFVHAVRTPPAGPSTAPVPFTCLGAPLGLSLIVTSVRGKCHVLNQLKIRQMSTQCQFFSRTAWPCER